MSWLLIIGTGWTLLSVAAGLLVGGAIALEEGENSGCLREGTLDGEREPGALKVGEEDALVRREDGTTELVPLDLRLARGEEEDLPAGSRT